MMLKNVASYDIVITLRKMNVIKYIVILMTVSFVHMFGQSFENFGFKLGYTSSNSYMYFEEYAYEHPDRRSSINVGIFKDFNVMKNGFVSLELNYSSKGFKYSNDNSNVEIDCMSLGVYYKYKLNYFSITPYFAIGPRYDYYFKITTNIDSKSNNDKPFEWERIFKSYAYGISGLLGVEFKLFSMINLITEIKYNYDLSNSFKANHALTEIKNNSFDVSVGIKF